MKIIIGMALGSMATVVLEVLMIWYLIIKRNT